MERPTREGSEVMAELRRQLAAIDPKADWAFEAYRAVVITGLDGIHAVVESGIEDGNRAQIEETLLEIDDALTRTMQAVLAA